MHALEPRDKKKEEKAACGKETHKSLASFYAEGIRLDTIPYITHVHARLYEHDDSNDDPQ